MNISLFTRLGIGLAVASAVTAGVIVNSYKPPSPPLTFGSALNGNYNHDYCVVNAGARLSEKGVEDYAAQADILCTNMWPTQPKATQVRDPAEDAKRERAFFDEFNRRKRELAENNEREAATRAAEQQKFAKEFKRRGLERAADAAQDAADAAKEEEAHRIAKVLWPDGTMASRGHPAIDDKMFQTSYVTDILRYGVALVKACYRIDLEGHPKAAVDEHYRRCLEVTAAR